MCPRGFLSVPPRASMEPSSVEDGNDNLILPSCPVCAASMEPSSVEDGNSVLTVETSIAFSASMEPSSVEDGNWTPLSRCLQTHQLQWSRPQLRTETQAWRAVYECLGWLQWSRPQLRTETAIAAVRPSGSVRRLQWSRPQLRTETCILTPDC